MQIKTMLEDRARDNSEKDEVRMTAFKGLMSCTQTDTDHAELVKMAERLVKESSSPCFTSYMKSYLRSVQSSSNPSKQKLRTALLGSHFFEGKLTSTRHLEMTWRPDETFVGMTVEADVVVPRTYNVPTLLILTLELPGVDKSTSILEVGLNQEGIKGNELSNINWNEITKDLYKTKEELMSKLAKGLSWSIAQKIHEKLHSHLDNVESAAIWIKLNGNHIYYMDDGDLRPSTNDPLDGHLALHRLLQSDEPHPHMVPIPNLIRNMIYNPNALTKVDCAYGHSPSGNRS